MSLSKKERDDLELVFGAISIKKQSIAKKYYKTISKKILIFVKKHFKIASQKPSI